MSRKYQYDMRSIKYLRINFYNFIKLIGSVKILLDMITHIIPCIEISILNQRVKETHDWIDLLPLRFFFCFVRLQNTKQRQHSGYVLLVTRYNGKR